MPLLLTSNAQIWGNLRQHLCGTQTCELPPIPSGAFLLSFWAQGQTTTHSISVRRSNLPHARAHKAVSFMLVHCTAFDSPACLSLSSTASLARRQNSLYISANSSGKSFSHGALAGMTRRSTEMQKLLSSDISAPLLLQRTSCPISVYYSLKELRDHHDNLATQVTILVPALCLCVLRTRPQLYFIEIII